MFSKMREPVNGLTHLAGAVLAVFGLIVLAAGSMSGIERFLSSVIYGLTLILLFTASAIYHLANVEPGKIEALRKLDHSAIYLLIAGTYTPICLIAFTGFYRWGLLAVIWSIAFVGISFKLYFINAPRWLSAGIYVMMGWLCVLAYGQMVTYLSANSLTWLITGGVIYTCGAVVYATKLLNILPGKFGYHEVWHIFVLLGAAAHFAAIFGIIYPNS